MDYSYFKGESFVGLFPNYTEQEVIEILGYPDKIDNESFNNEDGSSDIDITYIYKKLELKIMFNYYKSVYYGMSIFAKKILINSIDLFSLNKKEVLKIISKLSDISIQNALNDVTILESCVCEEYKFSDINIILWFDDEKLDEICVYFEN